MKITIIRLSTRYLDLYRQLLSAEAEGADDKALRENRANRNSKPREIFDLRKPEDRENLKLAISGFGIEISLNYQEARNIQLWACPIGLSYLDVQDRPLCLKEALWLVDRAEAQYKKRSELLAKVQSPSITALDIVEDLDVRLEKAERRAADSPEEAIAGILDLRFMQYVLDALYFQSDADERIQSLYYRAMKSLQTAIERAQVFGIIPGKPA